MQQSSARQGWVGGGPQIITAGSQQPSEPRLVFDNVSKTFVRRGQVTRALGTVRLAIGRGEFVAVVGPSGCGKSTLLNMAAGLMRPSSGRVIYEGKEVGDSNPRLGYATQRDTLFPWLTVEGNVALPLKIQGVSSRKIRQRVDEMIQMLGLAGFEQHLPAQLSGGMRKRVVLGRALVYRPQTIVLDEPFGALDAQLRQVLQQELADIVAKGRYDCLLVTHDLEEAIVLADRVIVMSARPGTIMAEMTIPIPRPRTVAAARFMPEFASTYQTLWQVLGQQIHRNAI